MEIPDPRQVYISTISSIPGDQRKLAIRRSAEFKNRQKRKHNSWPLWVGLHGQQMATMDCKVGPSSGYRELCKRGDPVWPSAFQRNANSVV